MAKIKPTPSELEILKIIWDNGPSSVRVVHDKMSEHRDVFYTTTLKTMQVMATKDLLTRDTSLRSHIYSSKVRRADVEKSLIDGLVNSVFHGSTAQLIISAIGHQKPKPDELKEIKSLLDQLENDE